MSRTLRVMLGTMVGFFIPIILLAYANWDIDFITTIGSWEKVNRLTFGFFLIGSTAIGYLTSTYSDYSDCKVETKSKKFDPGRLNGYQPEPGGGYRTEIGIGEE